MPHPRLSNEEIDQRGQELYDRKIRPQAEIPENIGKQIVIDIETGDYEIDEDGLKASRCLIAKHPGAALYGLRIGYNAVYTIGGPLTLTTHRTSSTGPFPSSSCLIKCRTERFFAEEVE